MMKGRYLIIENKIEEELLYSIVDFLWNNGNEVIVQGNFGDKQYYQRFLNKNPWIVLVDENDFSETENAKTDKRIIHFSAKGVYTNAIPFPHRIFEFEQLNKAEVNRFFRWCVNLNLFSGKRELIHQN